MKHLTGLLAALLAAFAFSGCALTMNMHANRFQSPEVEGRLGEGYVDMGIGGSNELVQTSDQTQNPPNLTSPYFQRSDREYYLGGGIGLTDRLNVELRNPFSDTGILEAKYQFLGEPHNAAKEGNFSFSAAGGVFYAAPSQSNADAFANVTATSSRNIWTLDAALLAGYRFTEAVLLYASTSYTYNSYSGKIDQTVASVPKSYNFSGTAHQIGFNLGFEFSLGQCLIKVEEAYAIADATQTNSTKTARAYTGVSLGFSW